MKRTLYFGSPAYLAMRQAQLVVSDPEAQRPEKRLPIEDLGVIVLDHPQITVTHALLMALIEAEVAVVSCDATHHPSGLLLPMTGHHLHQARVRLQIEATLPLRKQLWRQTVQAKLRNQAALLDELRRESEPLWFWAARVKSGDSDNLEARGAAYYWKHFFPPEQTFRRDAEGAFPNAAFNYGYAILRALTARSIVCAGLYPALGLHHRNQYNPYTLADDLMEPYRPFVDALVLISLSGRPTDANELTREDKAILLRLPASYVTLNNEQMPVSYALTRSVASVVRCLAGEDKRLEWPSGILLNESASLL